ncbi:MAG: hypothetical protein Q9208_003700 [Pyrenodesmia sp. 3 TL-2023]
MARPTTHLNLSSIYPWQEAEKKGSLVYNSILVLSKSDGSIIRSTGLLATTAKPASVEAPVSGLNLGNSYSLAATLNEGEGLGEHDRARDTDRSAEHIARIVFKVLGAGNELADEMEAGDDTKLLRIRTRKNEIVIVPDPKFILVVIHDAPHA